MSRDEAARIALRRLARGTDGARGPGRSSGESLRRLTRAGGGSAGTDERPPITESSERETDVHDGTATDDEPATEDGTATDLVGRAAAAVRDLDAAARFAEDGGVDALATALTDRRNPGSASHAQEWAAALRAFCAFERAAAGGRSDRAGSQEWVSEAWESADRTDPSTTSAADSPDI